MTRTFLNQAKITIGMICCLQGCMAVAQGTSLLTVSESKHWVASTPNGGARTVTERSDEVLDKVAKCAFEISPSQVPDFLSTSPLDPKYKSLASAMSRLIDTCMNSRIGYGALAQFAPDDLRFSGKLAERVLNTRTRPHPAAVADAPPNYLHRTMLPSPVSVVVDLAACVTEVHPDQVTDLIEARPGTRSESKAFGALSASMAPCLNSGQTLSANRGSLRAAFAIALYRRVIEPVLHVPSQGAKE